jgi:gluconolactonase
MTQVDANSMHIIRTGPDLDKVILPDAQITKVASGFKFTEGPMWRNGNLWFSDVVGNTIYAISSQGKVATIARNSGGLETVADGSFRGSNGMAMDKDGTILVCQHGLRRIGRMDSKGKIVPFIDRFEGKRLNSPNDLVFAPDGSLWFTDPPYGLSKQDDDPGKELNFNGVYRYRQGKLEAVIRKLPRPNGIGFAPDGRTLYVSNSGPEMFVNAYQINGNSSLSRPSLLISYPNRKSNEVPDGLKVDSYGNIWTTGPGGLRIISPAGKVLGQIRLPEVAANVAWGEGGKAAYITASTSIYRISLAFASTGPLYSK